MLATYTFYVRTFLPLISVVPNSIIDLHQKILTARGCGGGRTMKIPRRFTCGSKQGEGWKSKEESAPWPRLLKFDNELL